MQFGASQITAPSWLVVAPPPPPSSTPPDAASEALDSSSNEARSLHAAAYDHYVSGEYLAAIELWREAYLWMPPGPEHDGLREMIHLQLAHAYAGAFATEGDVELARTGVALFSSYLASLETAHDASREDTVASREALLVQLEAAEARDIEARENERVNEIYREHSVQPLDAQDFMTHASTWGALAGWTTGSPPRRIEDKDQLYAHMGKQQVLRDQRAARRKAAGLIAGGLTLGFGAATAGGGLAWWTDDPSVHFAHKQGLNLASSKPIATAEFSQGLSASDRSRPEDVDKIALLLVGGRPIEGKTGGSGNPSTAGAGETTTDTDTPIKGAGDSSTKIGGALGGGATAAGATAAGTTEADPSDVDDGQADAGEETGPLPTNTPMRPTLDAVDTAALACGSSNTSMGDDVEIRYVISPSGKVTSATVEPPVRGSPLGTCVAKAFSAQSYPKSVEGRSGVQAFAVE